jgi:transcriptional regulator with GAF, ATPase, and Fis domain
MAFSMFYSGMFSGKSSGIQRSYRTCQDLPTTLRDAETDAIDRALDGANGNLTHAAKTLGCTRQGLRLMIKRLNVRKKAYLKEGS